MCRAHGYNLQEDTRRSASVTKVVGDDTRCEALSVDVADLARGWGSAPVALD